VRRSSSKVLHHPHRLPGLRHSDADQERAHCCHGSRPGAVGPRAVRPSRGARRRPATSPSIIEEHSADVSVRMLTTRLCLAPSVVGGLRLV
jgi:hypothetical protein